MAEVLHLSSHAAIQVNPKIPFKVSIMLSQGSCHLQIFDLVIKVHLTGTKLACPILPIL